MGEGPWQWEGLELGWPLPVAKAGVPLIANSSKLSNPWPCSVTG